MVLTLPLSVGEMATRSWRLLEAQDIARTKPGMDLLTPRENLPEVGVPLLDYVFVEWENEGEHTVLQGKLVELCDKSSGYVAGTKVLARLTGRTYAATIIAAGIY